VARNQEDNHMPDVRSAIQFSVFLVNKPGVLAQVTAALAEEKVNIVAMTLVDSQEHGVLRLVGEEPKIARAVLAKLNLPMTETEVLCVDLPNQTGALAEVATVLGKNHININYAYCTSGAPGGRTTGVFKTGDQAKAEHLLGKGGKAHKEADLHRGRGRR
jgi:hypothetical protein